MASLTVTSGSRDDKANPLALNAVQPIFETACDKLTADTPLAHHGTNSALSNTIWPPFASLQSDLLSQRTMPSVIGKGQKALGDRERLKNLYIIMWLYVGQATYRIPAHKLGSCLFFFFFNEKES